MWLRLPQLGCALLLAVFAINARAAEPESKAATGSAAADREARRSNVEPRHSPIRGEYTAPPGCPDAELFWDEVNARTQAAADDVRLRVTLERRGERYWALMRLWLPEPGEPLDTQAPASVERHVEGARCHEASSAIALVVALALDARVQQAAQPTVPRSSMHWGLEAEAQLDTAMAPEWAWGAGIGVWLGSAAWRRQLGIVLGLRGATSKVNELTFRVDLAAVRAQPCPLSVTIARELQLYACAFVDAGLYQAAARTGFTSTFEPRREWWGSAGLQLRLQWQLSPRWQLQATPGIGMPFRRSYQLVVQDAEDDRALQLLHQAPPVSALGTLGVRFNLD